MADNLIIGVELLDYASELVEVATALGEAKVMAEGVRDQGAVEENYYGEALSEMSTFATQLVQHLDKLILLYQKGAQYTMKTYESMYQSDEAMALWMLKELEGEGG